MLFFKRILVLLFMVFSTTVFSQNTIIQRSLGGSRLEGDNTVYDARGQVAKDSGYIIVGTTASVDGDVVGLHLPCCGTNPGSDIWVVKLSKYGAIQWQKCLGGSFNDFARAVDTGGANTYFVAGMVGSNDGDVIGNHGNYDGFIAKLDGNGNIIWKKTIGGASTDEIRAVRSTPDGGCIAAGLTSSNDGDVSGNHNGSDGWVVKLDASGNIVWSRCYGSTSKEEFNDIIVTNDGKYVVAGYTNGNDGDVSGNHQPGVGDGWTLKVDTNGNILWKNCFGGNGDDILYTVSSAPDGGYMFGGWAPSACCEQVTPNWPGTSPGAWTIKVDNNGNFSWGKKFGGNSVTAFFDGITVSDGYIFAGQSATNGFDVQGPPYLESNVWVAKISFTGTLLWQRVLGGDKFEFATSVMPTYNGGYAISGVTNSNNGDISGYHEPSITGTYIYDLWFVAFTNFSTIKVNGFGDLNNNNIKDAGEPFFKNYATELYQNNTLIATNYPTADDSLRIYADTGSYVVKPVSFNSYYAPAPASFNANFPNYGNVLNSTVAFKPTGSFNDLAVNIIPVIADPRSNRNNTFRVYYENAGTVSIANPSINFVKDARTTFIAATVAPSSITGDSIKFNLSSLSPLSNGFIDITLKNGPALVINDTLRHSATLLPLTTDNTSGDNQSSFTQVIIGSYDPNDKQESHGGVILKSQVSNGDYLNYTIRFQNTGNDTAFSVRVIDTISSKYNLASLQMITSSHPFSLTVKGQTCTWEFPSIKLVDSVHNEPASHGFISYRIKARTDLSEGDTIRNNASIYFDNNPSVRTNQANTVVKVGTVTAVNSLNDNSIIEIFPNPVTDKIVTVKSTYFVKGNVYIEIYNNEGLLIKKQIIGKNLNGFTKQIDLSRYASGNYFILVVTEKKTYTMKLIKLK